MSARAVLGAAVGLALIAGPGSARTVDEIMSSGVLRACMPTASLPDGRVIPEGCTGSCGYGGVLGDLVDAFAESLDLTPEYWVTSWDGLFQNADGETVKEDSYTPAVLAEGRCDMISAVMVSLPWRTRKMDMTCFLPSRMMVVTRRDRLAETAALEDLGGRTAAVERNMSLHTFIEEQNDGPLAENPVSFRFGPFSDAIPAVDRGDADFTIVGVLDALYHTRHLVENSAAAFAVGPVDEGCWGYPRGDSEMGALMQAFWDRETADPESSLNAVWTKTYGLSFADFVRLVAIIE